MDKKNFLEIMGVNQENSVEEIPLEENENYNSVENEYKNSSQLNNHDNDNMVNEIETLNSIDHIDLSEAIGWKFDYSASPNYNAMLLIKQTFHVISEFWSEEFLDQDWECGFDENYDVNPDGREIKPDNRSQWHGWIEEAAQEVRESGDLSILSSVLREFFQWEVERAKKLIESEIKPVVESWGDEAKVVFNNFFYGATGRGERKERALQIAFVMAQKELGYLKK